MIRRKGKVEKLRKNRNILRQVMAFFMAFTLMITSVIPANADIYGLLFALTSRVITAAGTEYEVVVSYALGSGIPMDAELIVNELTKGSLEYENYFNATQDSIGSISDASFMDISIVKNGVKIEPKAPVKVEMVPLVEKADAPTVVHFPEGDTTESLVYSTGEEKNLEILLEGEKDISFTTASFSVFGVVYTVDFHWQVGGESFEYSINGGDSISLRELAKAVKLFADETGDFSDELVVGNFDELVEEEQLVEEDLVEDTLVEEDLVEDTLVEDAPDELPEEDLQIAEVDQNRFLADVRDVSFSDPSLIWVGKTEADTTAGVLIEKNHLDVQYSDKLSAEDIEFLKNKTYAASEWVLLSLAPFESEETLTITMKDGEEIKILVTDAQLKKRVIAASGETYEITVTYDSYAEIPDDAELVVKEILPDDEGYGEYYKEASDLALQSAISQGLELPILRGTRVFDIEIQDNGEKIEPKSLVDVEIRLVAASSDFTSVVHFANSGAENVDVRENDGDKVADTTTIQFETSSFSVYVVQNVSNQNLNNQSFIIVSGIAGDPGAETGYNETWGTDYFTRVVNAMAMTDEAELSHGRPAIGVHVWSDSDGSYAGGEATQWTFEAAGDGSYYIKNSKNEYLEWYSYNTTNWGFTQTHYDGLRVSTTGKTAFKITPTGASDGSVYITLAQNGYTNWYVHNNQFSGANEWSTRNYIIQNSPSNDELATSAYRFKLCKYSEAYDSYTAEKISVQTLTDDSSKNYIIYRKFVDDEGNEYLFALASDGEFVRLYDGGNKVYWRETDKNIYWHYELINDTSENADKSKNGHYLYSTDGTDKVYLYPKASSNPGPYTIVPESDKVPLTMLGKDDGESYSTTIERWDQSSYDYAGLHVVRDGSSAELSAGTRNAGTSDEYLFALAGSMPSSTATQVSTVDSDALGIKITMFDYGSATTEYAAGTKLSEMTAIAGSDAYTPHEAHELVKAYLVDGLPANISGAAMHGLFDEAYDSVTGSAITDHTSNVTNLFLDSYYKENGTFRYRSEDNYAYLDPTSTTDGVTSFKVYEQVATPYTTDRQVGHAYYYHGHFMPYNDIDMTQNVSRLLDQYGTADLPLGDGRSYTEVYGIQGIPNYYTGMKMEATFVQPSGGTLENGDDMVFKFTGDDDMWVYIDDVLVLDIGGIHEPLSGYIDFSTGKVINPTGSSLEGERTLYDIFMAVKNDPNTPQTVKDKIAEIKWNGSTFADFTTHSFSAFYMERGAGASNLDLQFNLKIAKPNEFTVSKAYPEGVNEDFTNQLYKFEAFFVDETDGNAVKSLYPGVEAGNKIVCKKVVYKDKPTVEVPFSTETIGGVEHHYFYLVPGQEVLFELANDSIQYKVQEVEIDTNIIKQVDINDDGNVQINGNTATSQTEVVAIQSVVAYTNHPRTQALNITKLLSEDSAPLEEGENPTFEFHVYLESIVKNTDGTPQTNNGKPVTKLMPYAYSNYYLVKEGVYYTLTGTNNAPVPQGTTPVVCSTTGKSGSINSIPIGYTIVIPNIPIGTNFYIEERSDNIPVGFEYDTEELVSGTYDTQTMTTADLNHLTTSDIDAIIDQHKASDEQGDGTPFDPHTIGRIKGANDFSKACDAESKVFNKKDTIEIPVEKVWNPTTDTPENVTLALIRYKVPMTEADQHQIVDETQGAIILYHYADFGNGNTDLPNNFHATYTITNKDTNEDINWNVPENQPFIKDIDPGEYTVTATVTNSGTGLSYYQYDHATSTESVDVTVRANQSSTVTLTSNYITVPNGKINITHAANYTNANAEEVGVYTGSTSLPDGFVATYTIKDNSSGRTIYTNISTGEYELPPGTYTVSAQISNIAAPVNYYYMGTNTESEVEVLSNEASVANLVSTYQYRAAPPQDGKISFTHVAKLGNVTSTSPLPTGFQGNVVIEGANKTIENANPNTLYDVPPGNYTIYVKSVTNQGEAGDYFYSKTDPITVTVNENATVSPVPELVSEYGAAGYMKISHVAYYNDDPTNTELLSGINLRRRLLKVNGDEREEVDDDIQSTELSPYTYTLAPGDYVVEVTIYYEGANPLDYSGEGVTLQVPVEYRFTIVSDQTTQATVTTHYTAPQKIGYTITGTWTDTNGNVMSPGPSTGEVKIPIRGKDYAIKGWFTLNSDNNWTGYVDLPQGGGDNNHKYKITADGMTTTEGITLTLGTTELADDTTGNFTYTGVGRGNTAQVYLDVAYSPQASGTPLSVAKGSTITLSYHSYTLNHGNWQEPISPNWELHYWNGNSWSKDNTVGGGTPSSGSVDVVLTGDAERYCFVIVTDPNNAQYINPSISLKTITGSLSSYANQTIAAIKSLFGPVEVHASEGNDTAITPNPTPTDLTNAQVQSLDIPSNYSENLPKVKINEGTSDEKELTYILDTSFGKQVVLSNPWKYKFEKLPEYDPYGYPYYYALVEVSVPEGYTVSYNRNLVSAETIRRNMDEIAAAASGSEPALITLTATNTKLAPPSTEINILKTDKESTPLTGAKFKLRKYNANTYFEVTKTWPEQTVSNNGTLTFTELEAGYYEIVETEPPLGYVKAGANPKFEVKEVDGALTVIFTSSDMVTYNPATSAFNIKNEPGAALPATGGSGTIIFYTMGALLTILAGIMMKARAMRM